jgi:hypothetical protein
VESTLWALFQPDGTIPGVSSRLEPDWSLSVPRLGVDVARAGVDVARAGVDVPDAVRDLSTKFRQCSTVDQATRNGAASFGAAAPG